MTTKQSQSPPADHSSSAYQNLFHPGTIAVIGASSDPLKPGGRVIKNIQENGYGGRLWAVNPKAGSRSILGLPTYPGIQALPDAPELAIVAIPAAHVLSTLKELAKRRTPAVIVLTAGFGEKDEAGRLMEQEMRRIADDAKMVLIGPNCSGFLTRSYKGKFAGIIPRLPGGAVDFISGSGAMVDYVMERASGRGLSFGTVINLGNSVQMGVEDLLELYDRNYGSQSARILMLYLESVKKPVKLLHHARGLFHKGCALIGIKSGATAIGERAAASHTGAMATSDTAVEALFEKAGILRMQGRGDLINAACVLQAAGGRLKGKRVCIITDAGGPGVALADELARQGMELPLLQARTRAELAGILPPEASTQNPIDALPSRTAEQIKTIIRILTEHEREHIDVIAVLTGNSGLSDMTPIYTEISAAMRTSAIPVLPVLSSVTSCRKQIADFVAGGRIYFPDEVELGRALGRVARWTIPPGEPSVPAGYDRAAIQSVLSDQSGALAPAPVRRVLKAAGIRLPDQIEVLREQDLAAACRQAGYPLAMKVIGPLHKTDAGGVRLGIQDEAQALTAWKDLIRIRDARGVLIQPMIDGKEVIMGASRQGEFGHLVMFGLGGIYAEAVRDVKFALAPLDRVEALRMIRGIRSFGMLQGVRGETGMDVDILADWLRILGRLVADFPQIGEIDLNPVKGVGSDLYAVDARIIATGVRCRS